MADQVGHVRISLSGTPLENQLPDFHWQLKYLLPGSLSKSRFEFQRNFASQQAQCALSRAA